MCACWGGEDRPIRPGEGVVVMEAVGSSAFSCGGFDLFLSGLQAVPTSPPSRATLGKMTVAELHHRGNHLIGLGGVRVGEQN